MEIIGYCSAILIGLSLGLIGGGGSILTIPILVYLFKVQPHEATTYSLFIVGFTAAIGAYRHYKMGNIQMKSAMPFAIPSLIAILIVRKFLLPQLPEMFFSIGDFAITKDIFIMSLFAILMVLASISMIKSSNVEAKAPENNPLKVAVVGVLVGIVTGFLGAGGGFLIIPALIFFTGMTMKQAVGTSLFIIAFNALLGFGGDLINGVTIDYMLLLSVSFFASIGIFIGTMLSKKVDGNQLKPAFGWFVLVMGIYILLRETVMK